MRFEEVNYLRIKKGFGSTHNFLRLDLNKHIFKLGGKKRSDNFKASFSDKELKELKKDYGYLFEDKNIYVETFLIEAYKSPLSAKKRTQS